MGKGKTFIISGPSGVGKGTIVKALMQERKDVVLSVSATTREPRSGEVDGVHYHFIDVERFRALIEEDAFLEYAEYVGNFYGTPKKFVDEAMENGKDVILEIDVQGAMKVKEACPDAVLVFIAPPSLSILKERLVGRGTETQESIDVRTATARNELKLLPKYDYMVINDVVDEAVAEMESILTSELLRTERNTNLIAKLTGGETI